MGHYYNNSHLFLKVHLDVFGYDTKNQNEFHQLLHFHTNDSWDLPPSHIKSKQTVTQILSIKTKQTY